MADALYNNSQHIDEPAKPVRMTPASAEIKAGDFVISDSGVKRASSMSDAGTLAQNQEAAHDVFLGIALDQSPDGNTNDILVASEGIFKRACVALGQAYVAGTYFGLAGTGVALAVGVSDTLVVPVATANLAVGVLSEDAASGATEVKIRLAGVLTTTYRGCQAAA